jgi:hypothetical protein
VWAADDGVCQRGQARQTLALLRVKVNRLSERLLHIDQLPDDFFILETPWNRKSRAPTQLCGTTMRKQQNKRSALVYITATVAAFVFFTYIFFPFCNAGLSPAADENWADRTQPYEIDAPLTFMADEFSADRMCECEYEYGVQNFCEKIYYDRQYSRERKCT